MLTLDTGDLCLNIPLGENLNSIMQFLLLNELYQEVCILVQNYVHCGTEFCKACRVVAVG
jgi:hypothetical protein